jgi:hypothetical protein
MQMSFRIILDGKARPEGNAVMLSVRPYVAFMPAADLCSDANAGPSQQSKTVSLELRNFLFDVISWGISRTAGRFLPCG